MKHHTARVRDWMTRNPVTIRPESLLEDAYGLMLDYDVRRLPVVNGGGVLVGIVTRSDIERLLRPTELQFQAVGERASEVTVAEGMTADPATVGPNDTIQEAAARLLEYQISGLPVLAGSQLVGIITETDFFRLLAVTKRCPTPEEAWGSV